MLANRAGGSRLSAYTAVGLYGSTHSEGGDPLIGGSPASHGDADDDRRWYVLYTKSRQEKALADTLESAAIEYFLPLYKRVTFYGHRRRVVLAPLFPSYLFLRGTPESKYLAIDTKRVARVLDVRDQDRFEHELAQIHMALAGEAKLDPYPFLERGRRVRVKSGPFLGIEGLVDERLREDRLILIVQMIGHGTSLEIDASLLEPVG